MSTEGFGEMVEKLRRATVQVSAGRNGHGSGVVVKAEGVIITNAHVVAFKPLEVSFWDGSRAPAELQLHDVARDLAILRVSRLGLPAARLADSDRLRIGEPVIAIGNPLGFIGALTTGVVRGIGAIPGLGVRKWIQSDVRLAPGNSGGPLGNASGVVGINTMVAGRVGLAVPSNSVSRLLERGPARAPLGVTIRPVAIRVMGRDQTGLLVLEIARSSAAEMASLMSGDILIGVDGKYFGAIEDFEEALEATSQRVIRLHFVRGDRSHIRTVAVRLGVESTVAA
jgi:serine protease Do